MWSITDRVNNSTRFSGSSRAQTAPLAVILVFAMVIGGSTLVVVIGGQAISETQSSLDTQRAENTMTQLDSNIALVALGGTSSQSTELNSQSNAGFAVEADSGWANVSYKSASGGNVKTIFNETMGAIVYENGNEHVAYQGGGVWKQNADGSVMVSPPEVHYREATLTMPLVLVRGEASLTDRAVFSRASSTRHFPNESADTKFINPVEDGDINLTVQSRYYEAWGNYFQQRTEGTVEYDHPKHRVTIELEPPFDESFDHVMATTSPGGITNHGAGSPPTPNAEGVNYPAVDSRITDQIDKCQSNPGPCYSIPAGDITTPGMYFNDGDYGSGFSVDNPGGNVTVVVNGDFEPGTVDIQNIDADHSVTVYVNGSFDFNSNSVNENDGQPDELSVLVHSDGDVEMGGNYIFRGLLYAPRSSCDFNGGGAVTHNFKGGMVCETATINGNPNNFDYSSSVTDISLDLSADDVTRLNYLHVSTNKVNVSSRSG